MNEARALALTLAVKLRAAGASISESFATDADELHAFLTKDDVAVSPVDCKDDEYVTVKMLRNVLDRMEALTLVVASYRPHGAGGSYYGDGGSYPRGGGG